MQKLAVITTYYNPERYVTRKTNYDIFKKHMDDSGVLLVTVECTFGDEPYELPESDSNIRLNAKSVLWQKERLLNIAAESLPDDIDAVAWIDCDVIFENKNWVQDTLDALDRAPIAQLFTTCLRLTKSGDSGELPDMAESFASVMNRFPESLNVQRYDVHGHSGYAWAMRRDIFREVGLYEHAISGSADHFMAHAIYGDYGFCIENALKHDETQIKHLQEWGKKFHALVDGQISVVRGQIRHLWHGDLVNRNYFGRMHQITDLGYNPYEDLLIEDGKPIEWAAGFDKQGLIDYFNGYYSSRKEDGELSMKECEKSGRQCCNGKARSCSGRHASGGVKTESELVSLEVNEQESTTRSCSGRKSSK